MSANRGAHAAPTRPRRRLPGPLLAALAVLIAAAAGLAVWGSRGAAGQAAGSAAAPGASSSVPASSAAAASVPAAAASSGTSAGTSAEYRAVWITYLEYQQMDLSGEDSFTAAITARFDRVKALGANTVIVHVRPFGDAMYRSSFFPWSHLLTGTQGQDPGYDPLAIMVREAHSRGLRIEAMVNPYRVRGSKTLPAALSADNPAAVWMAASDRADRVIAQGDALWYNPALPEVQKLIVDGVREICQNYDVDGIQFDDYFYPEGADDSFDQTAYDELANGADRAAWRRRNVDALVRAVYAAVHDAKPSLTFGISPQGNMDNNYNSQYSDVSAWMANSGYLDYVMPQIYWGFDYVTKGGNASFGFAGCLADWLALPRADGVKLYVGLGAYRIGVGEGGSNDAAEWSSGENLARQVAALRRAGADGYGLYSWRWLFGADADSHATAEIAALTAANG